MRHKKRGDVLHIVPQASTACTVLKSGRTQSRNNFISPPHSYQQENTKNVWAISNKTTKPFQSAGLLLPFNCPHIPSHYAFSTVVPP